METWSMFRGLLPFCVAAAALQPSMVFASPASQTPAGAGTLAPRTFQVAQAAPATPAAQSAPQFSVKDFRFTGNTIFPAETLASQIAEFKGRTLSLAQLQGVAREVASFHAEKGYGVVHVVVPPQEIADGIVTFQVIESRVGQVVITGGEHFSREYLRRHFNRVDTGNILKTAELERALLLLNETEGLKATASLQAGKAPGTTDILVDVSSKPRAFSGSTEFNTFGSTTAGRERLNTNLILGNLTGRGDTFNLGVASATTPKEMLFGQARYSTPINGNGTRMQIYGLNGSFDIGREFAILGMEGKGSGAGISFSHPLVMTRPQTTLIEVGLDARDSEMKMLGLRSSYDRTRSLRLGLTMDHRNPSAPERTYTAVTIHRGLGDFLGGMQNNDPLASRLHADNRFTKLAVDVTRVRQANSRLFFIGRVSGQASDRSLVSGEQIEAGGVGTVRGYPQGEVLGDDGFHASLEMRQSIGFARPPSWLTGLQVGLFADHGWVYRKKPVVGQRRSDLLTGAGIGLRADLGGFLVRGDLAYALRQSPSGADRLQPYLQVIRQY